MPSPRSANQTTNRSPRQKEENNRNKQQENQQITLNYGSTNARSAKSQPSFIETVIVAASYILLAITFPVSLFWCFITVTEYERAVIFRLGRLRSGGARGPGLFFILPCTDNYFVVDLRTMTFDVPCQEILTKDCVTVAVDAVVFYNVTDTLSVILNVNNYKESTTTIAATTLRNVMGTCNLSEILSHRSTLADVMRGIIDEVTHPWGIIVDRVEIRDVRLPVQLQRAMAAEAEATREARAKVIAAEGELKAAESLKAAADTISQNPTALQLRYLQTLNNISAEVKSTIVFPLPVDLLSLIRN